MTHNRQSLSSTFAKRSASSGSSLPVAVAVAGRWSASAQALKAFRCCWEAQCSSTSILLGRVRVVGLKHPPGTATSIWLHCSMALQLHAQAHCLITDDPVKTQAQRRKAEAAASDFLIGQRKSRKGQSYEQEKMGMGMGMGVQESEQICTWKRGISAHDVLWSPNTET
mmetsp:Transcript_94727/g.207254  ORF Transcript_94727/g.207254 Transcript_94727/m.207254 type:complete len:168 (-) Transcript_94727:9-512(-)